MAAQLGVRLELTPLSVASRIPALQMGRIDILIANLAYTKKRSTEIEFSYAYYVAAEALIVRAKDSALTPANFRGQRLSAVSASTSSEAIQLNGAIPITYHDVGEAYLALQEYKVQGMVTNNVTAHKLIQQVASAGIQLALIKQPMAIEPIAIGIRQGELAMLPRSMKFWSTWISKVSLIEFGTTGSGPARPTICDVRAASRTSPILSSVPYRDAANCTPHAKDWLWPLMDGFAQEAYVDP